MSKINYLDLDGNKLRTFITVLEEESVSKAAIRLKVTQSAVSHTREKLRSVFGGPLFVRSGRGITPTAKARSLRKPIEFALHELKSLTFERKFDPLTELIEFTIAANDFPMQLIFPRLLKEFYAEGMKPNLHFIHAGIPNSNIHRAQRSQILITPVSPKGEDYIEVELFQTKISCFYDTKIRKPPKTWKQFVESPYVDVRFSDTESSINVLPKLDRSSLNPPTVSVPNFGAVTSFIKGTDLIAAMFDIMKHGVLKGLDSSPLPIKTPTFSLYMIWHQDDHNDPAHQWFRNRIIDTANSILTD